MWGHVKQGLMPCGFGSWPNKLWIEQLSRLRVLGVEEDRVQSILGDGGAFVVGGTVPKVGAMGSVGRIKVEPWSRLSKFCFLVGV